MTLSLTQIGWAQAGSVINAPAEKMPNMQELEKIKMKLCAFKKISCFSLPNFTVRKPWAGPP
jgi:hypothetical protein